MFDPVMLEERVGDLGLMVDDSEGQVKTPSEEGLCLLCRSTA